MMVGFEMSKVVPETGSKVGSRRVYEKMKV